MYRKSPTGRKMDTNSVVGTQWVEGIRPTYEQAIMLAEQNLDEITTLSL